MKLTLNLAMGYAFFFSAFTYAQSPTHTTVIKNGIYQIINLATGQSACMENDNSIVQKRLINEIIQKWLLERQPDGSYKITNLEGGKVLQVNSQKKSLHAGIEQGNWNAGDSQRWYIRFSEKGNIKLQNKSSRYYMEVPRGTAKEGQVLQQDRRVDSPYQEWKLKERPN